jgi:hypothetical protein
LALLHGRLGIGDLGVDLYLFGLDVFNPFLRLQASFLQGQFPLGLHSGKGKLMVLIGPVLKELKDFG